MTELDKLKDELEQYQQIIEEDISEDVNVLFKKGNELSVIISRSGYIMAQSKKKLNAKMQSEIFDSIRKLATETTYVSARTVNAIIDSLCRDERFVYDWSERINKSATHRLEWFRTQISYAKQEIFSTRQFNT